MKDIFFLNYFISNQNNRPCYNIHANLTDRRLQHAGHVWVKFLAVIDFHKSEINERKSN